MLSAREILLGFILPALIAAGLLILAFFRPLRAHSWLLTLGLAVGYMVGYLGMWGARPFPPIDTTHWLLYLPIPAAILGLLISSRWFPSALSIPLVLVLYVATSLAILRPIFETITFPQAAEVVALISLAGVLSFASLSTLAARDRSSSIHLIMFFILAGTAQVILMAKTAYVAWTALILVAALAGALPLVWRLPISWRGGPTLLVVLLWHALLISSFFFSRLSSSNAMLLLIAPHLAWLAEGRRVQAWPKVPRTIFRVTVPLIPMLIAQTISLLDYLEEQRQVYQF
jgi:hypothetical protein